MSEYNDRQIAAILHVHDHPGCTAKDIAEAIEPGSDARGAAQTVRRIDFVERSADGTYALTAEGKRAARKIPRS